MAGTFEVRNPANNALVGTLPLTTPKGLIDMVAKAKKAKEAWANAPLFKRAEILYRFCDLFQENISDIASTMSRELGKPITQSNFEVTDALRAARAYIEKANHLYGDVFPENFPGIQNDLVFTRREPLGIVLCIVPFNFPINLCIHKVIPALIMGNVAIVKAPSDNPLSVFKMLSLLEKAGLPDGVCQYMVCDKAECTKHLVESPDVQAVSLTGSTRAGIEIAQHGASTLKHIMLELGGNGPLIIFKDADLDYAVSVMIPGRTTNAGQSCQADKRFIIHRSIQKPLIEKLVERLKKMKIGDALDPQTEMSCLVSEEAAKNVELYIKHTIEQGAKCVYGGTRNGAFVTPTVLVDVTRDMDVAKDLEIFGPVFTIITFDTEEEAITIANNTQYGLSAGIISKDLKNALRIASKIHAGTVGVNGTGQYAHPEQPRGGYKMSGLGREGISGTLEEYSQLKSYVIRDVFDK